MKGLISGLGWLAVALLMVGCETPSGSDASAKPAGTPAAPPPVAAGPGDQGDKAGVVGPDMLRAGDKLTILFTDLPNPPPGIEVRIRDDGTISLPYGVQIKAAGKKAGDLEVEIQKEYVPKYYRRLTVSVKSDERVIYVGGYVRMANRYVYTGEMTVLKAIKVAGDFNEYADRTKVELTRADKSKIVVNCKKAQKDPKLDPPVYPGDTIYVHQRVW